MNGLCCKTSKYSCRDLVRSTITFFTFLNLKGPAKIYTTTDKRPCLPYTIVGFGHSFGKYHFAVLP